MTNIPEWMQDRIDLDKIPADWRVVGGDEYTSTVSNFIGGITSKDMRVLVWEDPTIANPHKESPKDFQDANFLVETTSTDDQSTAEVEGKEFNDLSSIVRYLESIPSQNNSKYLVLLELHGEYWVQEGQVRAVDTEHLRDRIREIYEGSYKWRIISDIMCYKIEENENGEPVTIDNSDLELETRFMEG